MLSHFYIFQIHLVQIYVSGNTPDICTMIESTNFKSNQSLNEAEESTASIKATSIESENIALNNLLSGNVELDFPDVDPDFTDVENAPELSTLEPIELPELPEVPVLNAAKQVLESTKPVLESRFSVDYKSLELVPLDKLSAHPVHIYEAHPALVKAVAESIKTMGLINPIIVNKEYQRLSGNIRFEALKSLGYTHTWVIVMDIAKENELAFRITANNQRVKTTLDKQNEINVLINKFSPGQGSRDSSGINTIYLISAITGYSIYEINSIIKLQSVAPELIYAVDKGKISLHAAIKKSETVEKNAKAGEKEVKKKISAEPIECPCCGQKVRPNREEFYTLKKWFDKVSDFMSSLHLGKVA